MMLKGSGAKLTGGSDRRSHARIVWTLPLGFSLATKKQSNDPTHLIKYDGRTHDIGIGGVSCTSVINDGKLAKEISSKKKTLNLNIQLVEKNTEICTKAGVAWMYNLKGLSAKTKYRIGLGFENMTRAENDFLTSYLGEMIALKREKSTLERQKIKKVLAQIAKIDVGSFSEDTRIRQDLKVDSLMAMETLAVLETIYDIEVDVGRVVDVVTVGDMMDLIEGYLDQKAQII